jgi:uncharacterized membrane protein YidH (DUF202 family)
MSPAIVTVEECTASALERSQVVGYVTLIKKDRIIEKVRQRPTDALAIGRTVLANEQTFLGTIRTSVGLLASGTGLIKFLGGPLFMAAVWCLIFVSLFVLAWGIWRYSNINKLLLEISEEHL